MLNCTGAVFHLTSLHGYHIDIFDDNYSYMIVSGVMLFIPSFMKIDQLVFVILMSIIGSGHTGSWVS
jgi:hypothetical protein